MYEFKQMTQLEAEEIAHNWHYDDVYSFYDIAADKEDFEEFLDSSKRADTIFSVLKDRELIGFYSFQQVQSKTVDIGLGMRPDLTGAGMGKQFLEAGLHFVKETYRPTRITLAVATFNARAINVYKRVGFEPVGTFVQATNGSYYEFLKMERIEK